MPKEQEGLLGLLDKKPMKIMIVAKQNKIGITRAKRLTKELKKYTDKISYDPSTARRVRKLRKKGASISKFDGDMIITVGGDGTFLHTAHQATAPILPVKIEGHGFLCTTDFRELIKNMDKLMKKEYKITHRTRLSCSKVSKGRMEKYINRIRHRTYPHAANEIVFSRKRPSKILDIEFKIDETIFDFVGDGVMIATPSGSTAYHASAGGQVIDPGLDVISIVPLYPFFSNVKPLLIPASKKIEVNIKSGDCAVIVDGHGGEYISKNSEFIIEKGEPVKIINLFEYNFYEKLKKEFL